MSKEVEISNDFLNEILEIAYSKGVPYSGYEGSLQDNFIFYNAEDIQVDGMIAKYIIIKERFRNEWSSDLVLVMTNSHEEVEEFENCMEGVIVSE